MCPTLWAARERGCDSDWEPARWYRKIYYFTCQNLCSRRSVKTTVAHHDRDDYHYWGTLALIWPRVAPSSSSRAHSHPILNPIHPRLLPRPRPWAQQVQRDVAAKVDALCHCQVLRLVCAAERRDQKRGWGISISIRRYPYLYLDPSQNQNPNPTTSPDCAALFVAVWFVINVSLCVALVTGCRCLFVLCVCVAFNQP